MVMSLVRFAQSARAGGGIELLSKCNAEPLSRGAVQRMAGDHSFVSIIYV